MVEIAKAAGVAVGTLYRHYPTKTDLVSEVIAEHIDSLAVVIEDSASRVEAGHASVETELRGFMSRVLEGAARNPALKTAAVALPADAVFAQRAARIFTALERLVAVGRATGSLRSDLTGKDIALLTCTGPFDHSATDRERWVDLVWPGLLAAPGERNSEDDKSVMASPTRASTPELVSAQKG